MEGTGERGGLLRRTVIELGPLRITREHHHAPLPADYPFVDAPRARTAGGWRAAGLLGIALAASAGGLAIASTPNVPAPCYAVSVPVPARPIANPAPIRTAPAPKAVATVSRPAPASVEAVASVADGSRATAIAAALRSGEVQEWFEAAGQIHGFVVAGEAERDGPQTCRALSVLTRAPGGADRVEQRRECVPAAG